MKPMKADGLLHDTTERSYAEKLRWFERMAEPEIRSIVASLPIPARATVLDAGCGAGLVTTWLAEVVGSEGRVVGIDLSKPHCRVAAESGRSGNVLQADLVHPPFAEQSFDLAWAMNTLNHLRDPGRGLRALAGVVRSGGRVVLVQGHFLPEMIFPWDAPLERRVTDACHRYYRDKYGLDQTDTGATRRIVGRCREAGLSGVRSRTWVIERQQPLSSADREYWLHSVFRGYWGGHLEQYLDPADWADLQTLTDPRSGAYCLDRPDFHHVQTLTVVSGEVR